MEAVISFLNNHAISFELYRHQAVFTVAEAQAIDKTIPAIHTKNLFVHDKKKKRFFLISVRAEKRVDLNALSKQLGVDRLSFGSAERLQSMLGLTPGSVSPFGLLNDPEHIVHYILDEDCVIDQPIGFHPNDNTATVALKNEDFLRFLDEVGCVYTILTIPTLTI